jgi:tetratricopeptide (TPR) repeat protein
MQSIQSTNIALSALKPELDEAADALAANNIPAAVTAVKSLLTKAPSEYKILHLAGTVALAQNNPANAADYYRRALSVCRQPLDRARTLHGLGFALRAMNDLDAACEAFKQASLANKGNLVSRLEWGKTLALDASIDILNAPEKRTEAENVLRKAIEEFPDDPRLPTELGVTLVNSNRTAEAVELFDAILKQHPDFALAIFNRAVALTILGQATVAEQEFERALTLDPSIEGYYHLTSVHTFTADDPLLKRCIQHAESVPPGNPKIDIEFGLAKAFEDIGDYEEAFRHLETGNREKRKTIQYDVRHDEMRVDQIIALSTPDFFDRFRGKVSSHINPIFILGMPRSGSTLLEQMLAAHPDINAGGELPYMLGVAREIGSTWESRKEYFLSNDRAVIDDLQQGADTYSRLSATLYRDKPLFTDKLPGNFQFIGLIYLMFPNAKIINCRRDPVDTCLSCYKKLFQSAVPYSFDLTELGRYYLLYDRIMKHWHDVLPGSVLDVTYENLLKDPEQELRKVLGFCGVEFNPACLEFHKVERPVNTASVLQVRKPLYQDSVQRWKKYQSRLTPLLRALGVAD